MRKGPRTVICPYCYQRTRLDQVVMKDGVRYYKCHECGKLIREGE